MQHGEQIVIALTVELFVEILITKVLLQVTMLFCVCFILYVSYSKIQVISMHRKLYNAVTYPHDESMEIADVVACTRMVLLTFVQIKTIL